LDDSRLKSVIEGLIFAQAEPLSAAALGAITGEPPERVHLALEQLVEEYGARARGFFLARVSDGYQFRSLPEIAPWVLEMKKKRPARLTRAALEVLSIIAYNQPVTRSGIEQIRGVESSAILKSLQERDLVRVVGKKEIAGRPLLYGTTNRFLEVFGLNDLTALPPLPEMEDLPLGLDEADEGE
jgi:segregation and condensation protein B